jgi:hypothetical protein
LPDEKFAVGIQELRVVEDVVPFHADPQRADAIARQREVLGYDEVGIVDSGTVVPVRATLPKLPIGSGAKVEVLLLVAGTCGVDIHLAQIALIRGAVWFGISGQA